MPTKKDKNRKIFDPETFTEAKDMVQKGWFWFLKKWPAISVPLTAWMIFGGGIFLYNYSTTNKFEVKTAQPIGENARVLDNNISANFSLMPTAYAQHAATGVPIRWNGKLWGYEDTTFVAKVVVGESKILILDKESGQVYQVDFYGYNYKDLRMQQQYKR